MYSRFLCLLAGSALLASCSAHATSSPVAPSSPRPRPPADAPTAVLSTTVPAHASLLAAEHALLRKRYADAEEDFRRIIAVGKPSAQLYADLGASEVGMGHFSDAYNAYRHAVALDKHNVAYLYNAARAALFTPDWEGAVRYASEMIRRAPDNPLGYHVRMVAFSRLIMPRFQLRDARAVVRLRPRDAAAYDDLGVALMNTQQYRDALRALDRAIALQPGQYSYYSNRALVENLVGDRQAAIADYAKARDLVRDPAARRRFSRAIANLEA